MMFNKNIFAPSTKVKPSTKDFEYAIKRQKRKSIALHVLADASVEVRAPKWVSTRVINDFVDHRSAWVVNQRQVQLEKLARRPCFRAGEYHYFIGKQYPLTVNTSKKTTVTLVEGNLLVTVVNPENEIQIEKALEKWYRIQAHSFFEERLFACFESFPDWFQDRYIMPELTVRKMRRRWGSCSSSGQITLNLAIIKMPQTCIDYVIIHELCHLYAFDHGKDFYRLLGSIMPSWKQQEQLIERIG